MYSTNKNFALFGIGGIIELHLMITAVCFALTFFPIGIMWLLFRFNNFVLIWCTLSLIRIGFVHAKRCYDLNLYKIIDDDYNDILCKIVTVSPLKSNADFDKLGFLNEFNYLIIKNTSNKHYEQISLKEFLK